MNPLRYTFSVVTFLEDRIFRRLQGKHCKTGAVTRPLIQLHEFDYHWRLQRTPLFTHPNRWKGINNERSSAKDGPLEVLVFRSTPLCQEKIILLNYTSVWSPIVVKCWCEHTRIQDTTLLKDARDTPPQTIRGLTRPLHSPIDSWHPLLPSWRPPCRPISLVYPSPWCQIWWYMTDGPRSSCLA